MTVHLPHRLLGHAQVVSRVREAGDAITCDPCGGCVPQRVRRDGRHRADEGARSSVCRGFASVQPPDQPCAFTGTGKAFLDVAKAVAMIMNDVSQISASTASPRQMRQQSGRYRDDASLLVRAPSASDLEIDPPGVKVHLRPT